MMVCGAGDNSSEETLIEDLAAMQRGLAGAEYVELLLLIDRSPRWANGPSVLGEDFAGTRLFRLDARGFERIDGASRLPRITRDSHWEANTGDPALVRDFVDFGKAHFPAQHTALVFYGHGDGRAFAFDETSLGDPLFVGELGTTLESARELLPIDEPDIAFESWACFDLSRAAEVKLAADLFAVAIAKNGERAPLEALRGSGDQRGVRDYFPMERKAWTSMPYFDAYDLARRTAGDARFSEATRARATELAAAVDALVVASFGVHAPERFERDRCGASVVFPDGAREQNHHSAWYYVAWYSGAELEKKHGFGRLAWCADGATRGDGVVQNWFERLDSWYDSADIDGPNAWRS